MTLCTSFTVRACHHHAKKVANTFAARCTVSLLYGWVCNVSSYTVPTYYYSKFHVQRSIFLG